MCTNPKTYKNQQNSVTMLSVTSYFFFLWELPVWVRKDHLLHLQLQYGKYVNE